MAGKAKYEWPDDQDLQELLDEFGTVETARLVGCPPSSLSNRVRRRGLRGSKQRRSTDGTNGNGMPFEANADGTREAGSSNGKPEPGSSNGKPGGNPNGERGDESVSRRKPSKEPVGEPIGARVDERLSSEKHEMPGAARRDGERGTHRPPVARHGKVPVAEPGSRKELVRNSRPSEPAPEGKPSSESDESRSPTPKPFERMGSADYLVRRKPRDLAPIDAGTWQDDSDSAERRSHSKLAGALFRRVPPPIWRALAVVGLAAVAGIAAFVSVSGNPKTYQRESSFAVRPSETVPPAAINDVLGTLAQPDSAVTETIVNMFGSPRLRSFAARAAGVPPSSVGGSGAEYGWTATRRTGSTIIDMRLTGPDDDKLRAMQTAAGPEAARLVESSFPPYRLETLSAPSPAVQVGPKITRTVGLAIMLGALLGIILVLVERRLRSSLVQREAPSRAPPRGESWER